MNVQINNFSYGNYGNQYQEEEPQRPEMTIAIQVTNPIEEDQKPANECPDWECKIL
jgi:hypothetical protein